ncbi:hypothetical protein TROPICALSUN_104 [Erwinia phage vB_EamM_TropicalSun]|uniref:Uncharacterized protein n=1 Tax=Erwinia phage vB_EamM_TropicalSun TaxID=2591372 RepID=A0A5B9NSG2_9CAUD|nr:hypothetical protein TROPICALSUN_104 [Erwinia phage vB_EamM_TropicalSun]
MSTTKPVIRRTAKGLLRSLSEEQRHTVAALFDPKDHYTHRNRAEGNPERIVRIVKLAVQVDITKSCATDLQMHFKYYWSELKEKRDQELHNKVH